MNTLLLRSSEMTTDMTFSGVRIASVGVVVALARLTSSTDQPIANTSKAFSTALQKQQTSYL